jgi:hypothetical protein
VTPHFTSKKALRRPRYFQIFQLGSGAGFNNNLGALILDGETMQTGADLVNWCGFVHVLAKNMHQTKDP